MPATSSEEGRFGSDVASGCTSLLCHGLCGDDPPVAVIPPHPVFWDDFRCPHSFPWWQMSGCSDSANVKPTRGGAPRTLEVRAREWGCRPGLCTGSGTCCTAAPAAGLCQHRLWADLRSPLFRRALSVSNSAFI